MNRCEWCDEHSYLYTQYHDDQWGVPQHEDQKLFEMLVLEGFQAGLSWLTILKKREAFQIAFDSFDPTIVSQYDQSKIEELLQNKEIVRNHLKIYAAIQNAKVFLQIQQEFGSFDQYLWGYVNHTPIINQFKTLRDVPASTELSDRISRDLKARGMKFVGSTIIYAFLQAVGVVNDHTSQCFKYPSK